MWGKRRCGGGRGVDERNEDGRRTGGLQPFMDSHRRVEMCGWAGMEQSQIGRVCFSIYKNQLTECGSSSSLRLSSTGEYL